SRSAAGSPLFTQRFSIRPLMLNTSGVLVRAAISRARWAARWSASATPINGLVSASVVGFIGSFRPQAISEVRRNYHIAATNPQASDKTGESCASPEQTGDGLHLPVRGDRLERHAALRAR